jgi:oxygen-independent coproporphyrinogen-3 oxidase
MDAISLYFHIPFCRRRCGYCDFNTFAGMNQYIPKYVNALCREVEMVLSQIPDPVATHTIYFGGGTPSLLQANSFGQIFDSVRNQIKVMDDTEISLEANPETVSQESIKALHEIGFNRISFGMQSASTQDLRVLDRQHDNQSIVNAIQWSRQAGFEHINLDLIFGIPGQSLASWKRTLELALKLGGDHFSIYSLILEEGTRLKTWVDRGLLENPDDDLGADMYELAMDFLGKRGFQQYEISNWSRNEASQCRHNLQYWRYLPYLGFGAGAHGFWRGVRMENVSLIPDYIDHINHADAALFPEGPAIKHIISYTAWDQLQEHLMVSLRLTQEGVSIPEFTERYHLDMIKAFDQQISRLKRQGLLEIVDNGTRLRLTRRGRLLGNRVFAEFISNPIPKGFAHLG